MHDYSSKDGVVYDEILAPLESAEWMKDHHKLWNKIQSEFDKYKKSQFAHDIEAALPKELSKEQNIELTKEFVKEVFVERGLVCQVNVHYDNPDNPHMHLQIVQRKIVRQEDGTYTFGNKLRDFEYEGKVHGNLSSKSFLFQVRAAYAAFQNKHLELYGIDKKVTEKSFRDLGLEILTPTIKEGSAKYSDQQERIEINRQILKSNLKVISDDPAIILKMLSIEKKYFTALDVRNKITGLVEKVIKADQNFCAKEDKSSDFYRNSEGNVIIDSKIYSNLQVFVDEVTSKIINGENTVELEKLRGIGQEDKKYYTTLDSTRKEKEFITNLDKLVNSSSKSLPLTSNVFDIVNSPTCQGYSLSNEQKIALKHIVSSNNIVALEGYAGCGKSTLINKAKKIYQSHGFKLQAFTPTGKAADVFKSSTGIDAKTIDYLITKDEAINKIKSKILSGEVNDLSKKDLALATNYKNPFIEADIIFVDEAGAVCADKIAWINSQALKNDCKVVFIGDNKQFSAVKGVVGGFKAICDRAGSAKLTEIWRQKDDLDKKITKLFGEGRVLDGVLALRDSNNVKFIDGGEEAAQEAARSAFVNWYREEYFKNLSLNVQKSRENVFKELKSEISGLFSNKSFFKGSNLITLKSGILLAYENSEVRKLNLQIRTELSNYGILKTNLGNRDGDIIRLKSHNSKQGDSLLPLYQGEQIIFLKNDIRVRSADKAEYKGVKNGELGTIISIGKKDKAGYADLLVQLGNRKVSINTGQYGAIDYGYCSTYQKAQGEGYTNVFQVLSKYTNRASMYVGISRHMDKLKIFASKDVLQNVIYQKYGYDKTTNKIDISDKSEKDNLLWRGLYQLCARANNQKFVYDLIKNDKDCPIRQKYLSYQASQNEYVQIYRQMHRDFTSERESGNTSYKLFDHSLALKLVSAGEQRRRHAHDISKDPEFFSDYLEASRISIATIDEHAKREVFDIDKKFALPIDKEKEMLSKYSEIVFGQVQICKNPDNRVANLILEKAKKLCIEQKDIAKQIDIKTQEIKDLAVRYEEIQVESQSLNNDYNASLKMLSKIYSQDGESLANRFTELQKDKNLTTDEAIEYVKKSPEVLGNVRGKVYDFKLFKLSSFERRHNVNMKEELGIHLKRITDYSKNILDLKKQEQELDFKGQSELLNKSLQVLESKKLGDNAQKHINVISNFDNGKMFQDWSKSKVAQEFVETSKIQVEISKENKTVTSNRYNDLSLSYGEVKNRVSESVVSNIFRDYAGYINSDDKIVKGGSQLSVGSLNMSLKGSKMGLWHRFSNETKGDIFSFVEEATNCSKYEALQIVASYAGVSPRAEATIKNRNIVENDNKKEYTTIEEWKSCSVIPESAPKFNPKKQLPYLQQNGNKITDTYEYKNIENKVIGYTVRTENSETGSKQVIPVTYCQNLSKGNFQWRAKGFEDNGYKPVYGIENINKDKPILIVEGEKTAKKAAQLFPNYSVMSPLGGSSSVDKVNWSIFKGREVIIWPDNDKAGQTAVEKIADYINDHNKQDRLAKIVDISSLNLPAKWDLADKLPSHLKLNDITSQVHKHTISISKEQQQVQINKELDIK